MRPIKFRAWNGEKMSSPFELENCCNECGTYVGREVSRPDGFPMGGCKLMQYTGIKDKNGKEIYEGDFLIDADDSEPMRHRIVWYDDEAKFELETLEDEEGHWGALNIDALQDLDMRDFQIIGNIYENPELLKQEEI